MLMLVVGPSGAGKDTVLSIARAALADDPRFRFVRRVITRPADVGGEDHEVVSEAEFTKRSFVLRWQAHGLHYGIPLNVIEDLGRGIVVVTNVPRNVIAEAAERFSSRVIRIVAPPEILAQRLAARGRETAEDVANRLAREIPIPAQVAVDTVVNDRAPQEAADRFIETLIRAASTVQRC
jgi:ribose 1,5-bisphosphokinase